MDRHLQSGEIQANVDQSHEVQFVPARRISDGRPAARGIPAQQVAVRQTNASEMPRAFRDSQAAGQNLQDRRAAIFVQHGVGVANMVREGLAIVAIADRPSDAGRRNRAQDTAHRRACAPNGYVERGHLFSTVSRRAWTVMAGINGLSVAKSDRVKTVAERTALGLVQPGTDGTWRD